MPTGRTSARCASCSSSRAGPTALAHAAAVLERLRAAHVDLTAGTVEECGSVLLADATRRELAVTGVRVPRRERGGADSLTPSERRICDMAAQGLTNPQIAQGLFITVKTVEMHLGHAYRKLDISSRAQLATARQPA